MIYYEKDFASEGFIPEPENPDHWEYESRLKPKMLVGDAETADLRPFTSPRHNQSASNSCVAQSVVKALEIKRIMKNYVIYYIESCI